MKKAGIIALIILDFFIIYFLQADFFSWFNIFGIMPNLFVILILFVGLFAGKKIGLILGLIFCILIDLLIGKSIGISGILLGAIGLIACFKFILEISRHNCFRFKYIFHSIA